MEGWKTRHYLLFPMVLVCSFFGECGSEFIEQNSLSRPTHAPFFEKPDLGRKYQLVDNPNLSDFRISSNRVIAR